MFYLEDDIIYKGIKFHICEQHFEIDDEEFEVTIIWGGTRTTCVNGTLPKDATVKNLFACLDELVIKYHKCFG